MNGFNESIDTTVADHYIKKAQETLKNSYAYYMTEPKAHLQTYIDKYSFLVDGTASKEIQDFIESGKSFDEYVTYIAKFEKIIASIQREMGIVEFDMIYLICDDLKSSLVKIAKEHKGKLVGELINQHVTECKKVCEDFEKIKRRALKKPETTSELNDLGKFIEKARNEGVAQLGTRVSELQRAMGFLLENHIFSKEQIDLNSSVLLWPSEIGPVFDQYDELAQEIRFANESNLFAKREKLLIELDKIQKRIDEFSDYGELEMMKQYVDDVKSVQKRINEAEATIEWIRNEETEFKMNKSDFPLLDTIKNALDPFSRLFTTVLKWQRAEKKWTDGSFTDLNSELVEGECDEYSREIYKIQKQFNNIIKKRKLELQAKLYEKKKTKSNSKYLT